MRTVDVMRQEAGHQIAQPQCIEPNAQLLAIPRQHIAVEAEHLQIRQTANRCEVGSDRLAVELVPVTGVAGGSEHARRPGAGAHQGGPLRPGCSLPCMQAGLRAHS